MAVDVSPDILEWAIQRSGKDKNRLMEQLPHLSKWLEGTKKPTLKQLEEFAKQVYVPFGYLFLTEPPKEEFPIPFFRKQRIASPISLHVYDTILLLQSRQAWLREYLIELGHEPLPFVGKYKNSNDVSAIVADMRKTLELPEEWASKKRNWEEAQKHLVKRIEEKGMIVVFNSVVGNHTHRPIPVEECRGFVLIDDYAPFLFIHSGDYKAAQIFTIVHELAHIWVGASAGFVNENLLPAEEELEKLCDRVAAEFLVPEKNFFEAWNEKPYDYKGLQRQFKVSELVIARRALDTKKISKKEFNDFYNSYVKRYQENKQKLSSGGNFYDMMKKRVSLTFARYVWNAVRSGQLLYRDAFNLTGLKYESFLKLLNSQP